jgi:hypothetical protein
MAMKGFIPARLLALCIPSAASSLPMPSSLAMRTLRSRDCGDRNICFDLPHQIGLADKFVNYRRAAFTSRTSLRGMPHSSGQDLGVLKLASYSAVHWFKEFHDQMGLPTLDVDCEFI